MDVLKSYLPPGDGFLPKYLFFVSAPSRNYYNGGVNLS